MSLLVCRPIASFRNWSGGVGLRVLLVADWRSPLARGWADQLATLRHDVHVLSSHPHLTHLADGVTVARVPLALAGLMSPGVEAQSVSRGSKTSITGTLKRSAWLRNAAMNHVAARDLSRHLPRLHAELLRFDPHIVHALRIPFEGMFVGLAPKHRPLAISVWGNDFLIRGPASRINRRLTRRAVLAADGLHADCQRDLDEASRWGLDANAAKLLAPTNGGADMTPADVAHVAELRRRYRLPSREHVVLNPRGWRSYVRTSEYISALPEVARAYPDAVFLFADMAGNSEVAARLAALGLADRCRLLPKANPSEMRALFTLAGVSASPSMFDGTPNTLLEAMAAGSLPVAGDIPSIREWLVHHRNGVLCNPLSPDSIARSLIEALEGKRIDPQWRKVNAELVSSRAERQAMLPRIDDFYNQLLDSHKRRSSSDS